MRAVAWTASSGRIHVSAPFADCAAWHRAECAAVHAARRMLCALHMDCTCRALRLGGAGDCWLSAIACEGRGRICAIWVCLMRGNSSVNEVLEGGPRAIEPTVAHRWWGRSE